MSIEWWSHYYSSSKAQVVKNPSFVFARAKPRRLPRDSFVSSSGARDRFAGAGMADMGHPR